MTKSPGPELVFTYFNEINIIAQLSSNAFERALPPGLSQAQFSVLNWFTRVDTEATPGRLARAFMVTRGAMTQTLKKLEEKGYVLVRPDERSGRQKLVTMTPAGAEARQAALAAALPLMEEVLRAFSGQELASQIPALQSMRSFLDQRRDSIA